MPNLMTIKRVAEKTDVSQCAIRENIIQLIEILEIEEKVEILEHMHFCKQLRHRKTEEDEEEME